jgi:PIN domain nuclease of toxin-antitoxin system
VRLLLDTCVFLWLATEPSKLSSAATIALDDELNELFLSDASIWEITLKHKAGKLPLPDVPRRWIPSELQFHGIQSVSIVAEAMFLACELPEVHRVPSTGSLPHRPKSVLSNSSHPTMPSTRWGSIHCGNDLESLPIRTASPKTPKQWHAGTLLSSRAVPSSPLPRGVVSQTDERDHTSPV